MSFVYLQSEQPSADSAGVFTVGFCAPDGQWVAESDHSSAEAAAERTRWLNGGLASLRDLFAAQAMAALIKKDEYPVGDQVALMAYMIADEMLKERNREMPR